MNSYALLQCYRIRLPYAKNEIDGSLRGAGPRYDLAPPQHIESKALAYSRWLGGLKIILLPARLPA